MQLGFNTHQTADFVFDYLTDRQKFAAVHPVITRIDSVGSHQYLVHETLSLGFLPISFTYPVTIMPDYAGKRVGMRATVMGFIGIDMDFRIATQNGLTQISETIDFKTVAPLRVAMQSIFRKQHELLFQTIDRLNR